MHDALNLNTANRYYLVLFCSLLRRKSSEIIFVLFCHIWSGHKSPRHIVFFYTGTSRRLYLGNILLLVCGNHRQLLLFV